jgi:hypothetical protein
MWKEDIPHLPYYGCVFDNLPDQSKSYIITSNWTNKNIWMIPSADCMEVRPNVPMCTSRRGIESCGCLTPFYKKSFRLIQPCTYQVKAFWN